MTGKQIDPLEERRAEDAAYERANRQKLELLALDILGHAMRQAAWEIERDSGAAVSLRIRGNRAAYEEANK